MAAVRPNSLEKAQKVCIHFEYAPANKNRAQLDQKVNVKSDALYTLFESIYTPFKVYIAR